MVTYVGRPPPPPAQPATARANIIVTKTRAPILFICFETVVNVFITNIYFIICANRANVLLTAMWPKFFLLLTHAYTICDRNNILYIYITTYFYIYKTIYRCKRSSICLCSNSDMVYISYNMWWTRPYRSDSEFYIHVRCRYARVLRERVWIMWTALSRFSLVLRA